MLIWIIQSIILSVIFILILHNLICYFKDTLTIPKIKDLISSPSIKYENIYNVISNSNATALDDSLNMDANLYANNDDDEAINSMKNDLKTFLKSQLNNNVSETGAQNLDSVVSVESVASASYSAY
jgi:hypothetical protein